MEERDKSSPKGQETKTAPVSPGLGTSTPEEMSQPFPGTSTTGKGQREYVTTSPDQSPAGENWLEREAKASDHSTKTVDAEPGKGGKRRADEK